MNINVALKQSVLSRHPEVCGPDQCRIIFWSLQYEQRRFNMSYRIIETEAGLVVGEVSAPATGSVGTIVDPGPYDTYEDALEALEGLALELDPRQGSSEVPAERVLESRNPPS